MATQAGAWTAPRERDLSRFRGPLFVLTILLGSFLLFLVQPMVARMALPRLGGAPAVWNSAMLVYQALLLGGYAYAHWIGKLRPRRQAAVHVALLAVAALWLPIGLIAAMPEPDFSPVLWVPWLLVLSIGPLFFAVSAQAPLMQRWYSAASGGRDPYALYAASNLGSFAGLIAYPLLVEPELPLAGQSLLWTGGYVVLVALVLACAAQLPTRDAPQVSDLPATTPPPTMRRKLTWVALALVPSGLMLSTSTYLTTDIVAMPLLWAMPLGIYLLSFTVAFARRQAVAELITRMAPLTIIVMGGLAMRQSPQQPVFGAVLALTLLFVVSVALHAEMYRTRPAPERLTGFYLAMSIGGALGGVFAGLIAPVLFDWTYEHPILILAAGLLVPQYFLFPAIERWWSDDAKAKYLAAGITAVTIIIAVFAIRAPTVWLIRNGEAFGAIGIGLLAIFAIGIRPVYMVTLGAIILVFGGWQALEMSATSQARTRSYFGVYTVRDFRLDEARTLAHGTTFHGIQRQTPGREREPTSYYSPTSGVGQALLALPELAGPAARVGIVGLGTGTLACYRRPGQQWTFYEIDEQVVRIARDSGQFSFLSRCAPGVHIVLGDARLSLAAQRPGTLDLLALDAFSSDVVPAHLLTLEAFAAYGRVLAPDGMLLVHISNRFLDLEPVLSAAATQGGWVAAVLVDAIPPDAPDAVFRSSSVWVAMSRDVDTIRRFISTPAALTAPWRPLEERPGFRAWTDDFSSVLPLLISGRSEREER
ncbi:SAM-dependent methyltransferase [Sphingomonas jejuensis]|uniref:SAM-dependent methyltransferase n=1 Tax=Sphingomonas jejuensis TaxID=904715 RepID=A0ABX0XHW8_9SPHN|nr:fused MFS/spermidine synthase [Sphingomonas jejuensis]NJC32753.1 SAM-dependent methyltransferase [Sphingomonas jejuensis]